MVGGYLGGGYLNKKQKHKGELKHEARVARGITRTEGAADRALGMGWDGKKRERRREGARGGGKKKEGEGARGGGEDGGGCRALGWASGSRAR